MALFPKWIGIFTCCFLFLSACSTAINQAPIIDGAALKATPSGMYRVREGDTLYSIAWGFGIDYRSLARINNIQPPYALRVGQYLALKAKVKRPQKVTKQYYKKAIVKVAPKKAPKPVLSKPAEPKLATVHKWSWPANGKVIARYAPWKNIKGINISGTYGQPIFATARGIVVYRGTGLNGYGRLVIIKHNSKYLSAYAFNKRIFVKEGQLVKAGQKIASMGKNDEGKVMLHFEIRRAGKPVNPLKYLPRR